jgi:hypothetical protein
MQPEGRDPKNASRGPLGPSYRMLSEGHVPEGLTHNETHFMIGETHFMISRGFRIYFNSLVHQQQLRSNISVLN